MKRGLSLSLCIKDIIEGRVSLEEVHSITTSTNAPTLARWSKLLQGYAKDYWYHDPVRAICIAESMYLDGRIYQPRMEGAMAPYQYRGNEIWVDVDPYLEGIMNRE